MKEIGCSSCSAACCLDPKIEFLLTDKERDFLIAGGTEVVRKKDIYIHITEPDGIDVIAGIYVLPKGCGRIVEKNEHKECGVYENPNRPLVCKEYKMGGEDCISTRKLLLKQTQQGILTRIFSRPVGRIA